MKQKIFFRVIKGLSFGEKNKNLIRKYCYKKKQENTIILTKCQEQSQNSYRNLSDKE